jgi:Flp pilus assembly pilin Flp
MNVSSTTARFLWEEDSAQDVAEYCLITALVALVCLGIFWYCSGGLQGMWTSMNQSLANGNSGSTSAGGK